MQSGQKIVFANQLRGVAALLVVLSHLFCAFWMASGTVSAYTGAPPAIGGQPWVGTIINSYFWSSGAVGVALFFTISGSVIPMSIKNSNRLGFLVARALRIYPTYIVSLLVGLSAVWLSCLYWGSDLCGIFLRY
jgi:peptidoglycan/LPS O-acetylase OafA/YrhL